MTDALHLTPREVAQVEEALESPTPIDPADIRPGDVVERRLCERMTVLGALSESGPGESATIATSRGIVFADFGGYTWHLVSRPDPDAEAVEALGVVTGSPRPDLLLAELRERGWDVVRRAEP